MGMGPAVAIATGARPDPVPGCSRCATGAADAAGVAAAKRAADRPPPWEQAAEGADGERAELFHAIKQFAPAVVQIAQVGSPDQAQRAKEILDEARKKLYAILAEDE